MSCCFLFVRASFLRRLLGYQLQNIFDIPKAIRYPGLHCWCHSQRLMDFAEIVIPSEAAPQTDEA